MENIEYQKKQAVILNNLYNSKQYEKTITKGKLLIKKFPNQIFFYNVTALSLSAEGLHEEAITILSHALKREERNIHVLNNLGLIHFNLGLDEVAEEYYKKSLRINNNFFDALLNYGNLLLKLNKIKEAEHFLIKALKQSSNKMFLETASMSLGNLYQQTGDFDKSINHFKKVISVNPLNTVADKSISLVHTYISESDDHLRYMEKKLETLKDQESIKRLNFALGKAYEDIKNYKKSFKFIVNGNKIEKNILKYNINKDVNLFKKIKEIFKDRITSPLKDPQTKMIFIVGMPRSGTTLVEQIISAHHEVSGAGELSFLSESVEKKMLEYINEEFVHNDLNLCQKYYFDRISNLDIKKQIITDKAPLNFRWIGFIQILFPNSKIVHCKRDPMDTCWSNFKNSFASKSLGFSYDLDDLGKFYNLYKELMIFWNGKYPNKIYNLSYENLIKDKNSEIRKIIDFCELKWDENCLKPEENKKAVATASLSQVRSPVYKSSVKKWKNYLHELQKLNNIIKEN